MNDTLPDEIETRLDDYARASMNYRTTGQSPERERYDAARDSLVSAILDYARKERERGLAEALAGCKDCGVSIHDHGYEPGAPGDEGRVICPAPPSPGERGATHGDVERIARALENRAVAQRLEGDDFRAAMLEALREARAVGFKEARVALPPSHSENTPACGAERVNAARVAYACRRPPGHGGDHHPSPCGHDGCTGLECLRPAPARSEAAPAPAFVYTGQKGNEYAPARSEARELAAEPCLVLTGSGIRVARSEAELPAPAAPQTTPADEGTTVAPDYPGTLDPDLPAARSCACRRYWINKQCVEWIDPHAWQHTKERCAPIATEAASAPGKEER